MKFFFKTFLAVFMLFFIFSNNNVLAEPAQPAGAGSNPSSVSVPRTGPATGNAGGASTKFPDPASASTKKVAPKPLDKPTTNTSTKPNLTANSSGNKSIEFKNPISKNTVEDLLISAMAVIRNVVAALAILMIVIGAVMWILSGTTGQTEKAKTVIQSAVIGLAIALAAPTFIGEIYGVLGKDTPEVEGADFSLSVYDIAVNITNLILGFIGVLSILMIIVGGVMWMTNQSDVAKKMVKAAVIGLVIALTSLVIVKAIVGIFG